MSTKQTEALKLALKALEAYGTKHAHTYGLDGAWDEEITRGTLAVMAIREALAQSRSDEEQPAQQQEPVALDAIYAAWHGAGVDIAGGNWSRFVGMLPPSYEQPTTAQQKPAGYFRLREYGSALIHDQVSEDAKHNEGVFPLYTSPPASKPWVGLTDEEIEYAGMNSSEWSFSFASAIEAMLREKNA